MNVLMCEARRDLKDTNTTVRCENVCVVRAFDLTVNTHGDQQTRRYIGNVKE